MSLEKGARGGNRVSPTPAERATARGAVISFDAVVVGAGLGGLSAAGFLAKAGLSVCLVERAGEAGGCVAGLQRGPYVLEPAVGAIARGVEDELRDGILAHLGARERCELIPLHYAYRVKSRELELDVPIGLDGMIDVHCERFPLEREAIRDFFRTCDRILEDTHHLPLLLRFDELDDLAERFPTFVRYRTATLAEGLDEFFSDDLLKRVVAASWPWAGLTPSLADLERLDYATMVIKETIRIYPPLFLLARSPAVDDVVGGYRIPAKAFVAISPYVTHRHPEFWPNPEEFDPERFTPEREAERPRFAWIPFSDGPRYCTGMPLAMMQLRLFLAALSQRYRLHLDPDHPIELEQGTALRPKHGVKVRLEAIAPANV